MRRRNRVLDELGPLIWKAGGLPSYNESNGDSLLGRAAKSGTSGWLEPSVSGISEVFRLLQGLSVWKSVRFSSGLVCFPSSRCC